MVKNHLLRLAAPRTWRIERKKTTFISRPKPGAHSMAYGLPLVVVLRDILKIVATTKEAKQILNNKEVKINNKVVRDPRRIIGLMDILSIAKLKLHFRVLLDEKNKLILSETDEKDAKLRIAKINKKTIGKKGQTVIHFHNGENFIVKEKYKTGDSAVLETETNKISQKLELKTGAMIFLTGGKHISVLGTVVEIISKKLYDDQIIVKTKGEQFTTLKKYAFVIGEKESLIRLKK
ncbi:MAG: 30S ribosomal protein S4e [Nanoarchaeota archaeon]|nr:30S ribosomal protein S4e [Nanoarchaeota archaeon]